MNIQTAKNEQTMNTYDSLIPRKIGRPPGKKSDPLYRQVTIYIPAELHEQARKDVKDFSELVEKLLLAYLQTAKTPRQSNDLSDLVTQMRQNNARVSSMSDADYATLPGSLDDDQTKSKQRDIAQAHGWAAQGLITTRELEGLLAFHNSKIASGEQVEVVLEIMRRVRHNKTSAE